MRSWQIPRCPIEGAPENCGAAERLGTSKMNE
jgi:hypothetical protein